MLPATRNLHQLQREGVTYEMPAEGTHVIVRTVNETIHFWPSTCRWWIVGSSTKRGGIVRLIKYVRGRQGSAIRAIGHFVP